MYRRSFIENSAPDLYILRIVYHQNGGILGRNGVAYLEINKLPCLHEIDIPRVADKKKFLSDIGSCK